MKHRVYFQLHFRLRMTLRKDATVICRIWQPGLRNLDKFALLKTGCRLLLYLSGTCVLQTSRCQSNYVVNVRTIAVINVCKHYFCFRAFFWMKKLLQKSKFCRWNNSILCSKQHRNSLCQYLNMSKQVKWGYHFYSHLQTIFEIFQCLLQLWFGHCRKNLPSVAVLFTSFMLFIGVIAETFSPLPKIRAAGKLLQHFAWKIFVYKCKVWGWETSILWKFRRQDWNFLAPKSALQTRWIFLTKSFLSEVWNCLLEN